LNEVSPEGVIGKAKDGHRKDSFKLGRPVRKVILKLCMTLVCYSTWSMLSSPLGSVKGADTGGDDVGRSLNDVCNVPPEGGVGLRLSGLTYVRIEKRSRRNIINITDMEMLKMISPEVVPIPLKGRGTNFLVDLEELIDMFPCF